MKKHILSGLLFILYFGLFLVLKVVNEISNNSVEYLGSLNELMIVVVTAGVGYYLLLLSSKEGLKKDILSDAEDKLSVNWRILISVIASILVGYVVYNKTLFWQGGAFVSAAAALCTLVVILFSLSTDEDTDHSTK
jgi:magnesium-transporting ATPase (P-type)